MRLAWLGVQSSLLRSSEAESTPWAINKKPSNAWRALCVRKNRTREISSEFSTHGHSLIGTMVTLRAS